jgi:hypothetical protein
VSSGVGGSFEFSSTIFGGGGGGGRSSCSLLPAAFMGVGRQTMRLSWEVEDKRESDDEIGNLVSHNQPCVNPGMAAPRSPTQADQPARAYPLKWIEAVFNSKEKTENLLRPEVENGNVTYHDMELAQASQILQVIQKYGEVTRRIPGSLFSRATNAICQ